MKLKPLIGLASIYSMIAIFANIYQLLAYFQTGNAMAPYVIPWAIALGILYFADLSLLKKGITVERFLYVNVILGIIYIIMANLWFSNISGVLAHIFASFLIAITVAMTEEVARVEVNTNQLVLQLEISFVVLGIVLFFDIGTGFMVHSVIFNLFALVLSRTLVSKEGVKKRANEWKGMVLLGGLAVLLIAFGTVAVSLCTDAGRPFLERFIRSCVALFLRVVSFVNRVTVSFVNAIPGYKQKGSDILVAPMDIPSPQNQKYEVEFNIQFLFSIMLTIAVILFLIVVIRLILKKFAALRLNQVVLQKEEVNRVQRHQVSVFQMAKMLFAKMVRFLILQWNVFRYPNTPETWLIKAERVGRKYHILKMPAESPGGYLRRLAQHEKIVEKGLTEEYMEQAKKMDLYFYGLQKGNG